MYLAHFGLNELPFSITPDTQFIYAGSSHQGALNTLMIAYRTGEGFIKVTGEVGTGKTLLCRRFLSSLDEKNRCRLHSQSHAGTTSIALGCG